MHKTKCKHDDWDDCSHGLSNFAHRCGGYDCSCSSSIFPHHPLRYRDRHLGCDCDICSPHKKHRQDCDKHCPPKCDSHDYGPCFSKKEADCHPKIKVVVVFECGCNRLRAEGFRVSLDHCFVVIKSKEGRLVRIPTERVCWIEECRFLW